MRGWKKVVDLNPKKVDLYLQIDAKCCTLRANLCNPGSPASPIIEADTPAALGMRMLALSGRNRRASFRCVRGPTYSGARQPIGNSFNNRWLDTSPKLVQNDLSKVAKKPASFRGRVWSTPSDYVKRGLWALMLLLTVTMNLKWEKEGRCWQRPEGPKDKSKSHGITLIAVLEEHSRNYMND